MAELPDAPSGSYEIISAMIALACGHFFKNVGLLQRLLTSQADQEEQIQQRALVEFYGSHFHQTKDATGILIFVSLVERKAFVLADKAISEKVPQDTWDGVIHLLVEEFKRGQMGLGYEKAIYRCGEIVSPLFPVKANDKNELSDGLIIVE